jgi:hypothetical protein
MSYCELIGFEVLTTVTMDRTISLDATPSPVVHRYFKGTYCLIIQSQQEAKQVTSKKQAAGKFTL